MVFFFLNQPFAHEGFGPSPHVWAEAIRQAEELSRQAPNRTLETLFPKRQSPENPPKCPLAAGRPKGCGQTRPPSPKKTPQILVFVSFSLPEASLKILAQESEKHNAVLVMRGLQEDSFVKTAQKLQELGITVDLHPDLFERHQVTAVPTFLLLKEGHPISRLQGNVTLDFATQKFEVLTGQEAS